MNRHCCIGDQQPGAVDFARLAVALARQPMFGGHTVEFWSAAQHRTDIAAAAPADWRIYALLHDVSDAVFGARDGPVQLAEEHTFAAVARGDGLSQVTGVRLYRNARRLMTAAADRTIHLAAGCQYPPPAAALRRITDLDATLRARAESQAKNPAKAATMNAPWRLNPDGAAEVWLACLREEQHRRGWPTVAEKAGRVVAGVAGAVT